MTAPVPSVPARFYSYGPFQPSFSSFPADADPCPYCRSLHREVSGGRRRSSRHARSGAGKGKSSQVPSENADADGGVPAGLRSCPSVSDCRTG